jgi:hypothetical protein
VPIPDEHKKKYLHRPERLPDHGFTLEKSQNLAATSIVKVILFSTVIGLNLGKEASGC